MAECMEADSDEWRFYLKLEQVHYEKIQDDWLCEPERL